MAPDGSAVLFTRDGQIHRALVDADASASAMDRGEAPFIRYLVPSAALTLKQGFGRLLRSRRDRGIVAVLDWNRHPPVAGLCSAIFHHVWRKARHPTAGCVAFARADLEWVLARWTPRSRVVVRG